MIAKIHQLPLVARSVRAFGAERQRPTATALVAKTYRRLRSCCRVCAKLNEKGVLQGMAGLEWIDTHVHVSALDETGKERSFRPEDFLAVLEREPATLRCTLSVDAPEIYRMKEDPAWIMRANRFVHEVCQVAPDRIFGSCLVNPNFLEASLACMDSASATGGLSSSGSRCNTSSTSTWPGNSSTHGAAE